QWRNEVQSIVRSTIRGAIHDGSHFLSDSDEEFVAFLGLKNQGGLRGVAVVDKQLTHGLRAPLSLRGHQNTSTVKQITTTLTQECAEAWQRRRISGLGSK